MYIELKKYVFWPLSGGNLLLPASSAMLSSGLYNQKRDFGGFNFRGG